MTMSMVGLLLGLLLIWTGGAAAQAITVREGSGVNLREGPGTNYRVITLLPSGEELDQVGRSGDWIETTRGWVHADFVERKSTFRPPEVPAVSLGLALGFKNEIDRVARSPNGRWLATLSFEYESIQFWDYVSAEELASMPLPPDADGIRFLSDDRLLIYKVGMETAAIIDMPSLSIIYEGDLPFRDLVGVTGDYLVSQTGRTVSHHALDTYEVLKTTYMSGLSPQERLQQVHDDQELSDNVFRRLTANIVGYYFEETLGEYLFYISATNKDGSRILQVQDMNRNIISERGTGDIKYTWVFHDAKRAFGSKFSETGKELQYLFDVNTDEMLLESAVLRSDPLALDASPNGRYFLSVPFSENDGRPYRKTEMTVHDMDAAVSRRIGFDGRMQWGSWHSFAASTFGEGTRIYDDGTILLPVMFGLQTTVPQLWKIDVATLVDSADEIIELTDTHPAVTVIGGDAVDYRRVTRVAQGGASRIRFESAASAVAWFDPATMSMSTRDADHLLGQTLAFHDSDGMLHYISQNDALVGSEPWFSYVVGQPIDYFTGPTMRFEGIGESGPDIVPALMARRNWSGSGDRYILQGRDGYSYAMIWGSTSPAVRTASRSNWFAWTPLPDITPILDWNNGASSSEWVHTRDGSAFLAANDAGLLGTFFTDGRGFIGFDKAVVTALLRLGGKDRMRDTTAATLQWNLSFFYLDNGDLIAANRWDDDCLEPIIVSMASGSWQVKPLPLPEDSWLCRLAGTSAGEMAAALRDRRFVLLLDTLQIIDAQTGELSLNAPYTPVKSISASLDGRHLYGLKDNGTVDILSGTTGDHLVTVHVFSDGSWLIMTPEGFYTAGGGGDDHLRVTQGLRSAFSISKFRDALYRPDLVSEALNGDPEGLVRAAAQTVSLERILLSGAAPIAEVAGERAGTSFHARAQLTDSGGGIGRLEWRVNGVTQQTAAGVTEFAAELHLAEGENRIELVAYNRENTIQGRSRVLNVTVQSGELGKPRLHILALGVDTYALDALTLRYATHDATSMAESFAQAGNGLYSEIFTHLLLNEEVTRENLAATFASLAQAIRPNDVFLFFSAGHGKTLEGRYFYIPQDFTGTTVASIRDFAIGHAQWQEWFSMIPAQKSLLLFDTCDSGAIVETLVGRDLRFRSATDYLGNATGRALLSASSSYETAWEGYEGHGVFTYSILQALQHADLNEDGVIDIDELASTIQETVPVIAAEVWNERQTPLFKAPLVGFAVAEPLRASP